MTPSSANHDWGAYYATAIFSVIVGVAQIALLQLEQTHPLDFLDNDVGTVKVSVSAAVTVPVTDAAEVVPLMPVTATLTEPADDDSEGALYSGAEAEPGVYANTAAL